MSNSTMKKQKPNWLMDVKEIDRSEYSRTDQNQTSATLQSKRVLHFTGTEVTKQENDLARLKLKKAWDMALTPAKSLPMNGFMLYMAGSSIQIFSIVVTVMLLWNSLNACMGSIAVFKQFTQREGDDNLWQNYRDSNLILPVIVYVVLQLLNFGLGVWKLGGMGLLPTTASDWLQYLEPREMAELSFGSLSWK